MTDERYPPIDPSTIAPLANGVPDLYNNLPSRFVSRVEAAAREWPTFYDGSTCRYGHQAPRYVSNPRLCVDCHRAKAGKELIGAKAAGAAEYKRQYKQPTAAGAPQTAAAAPQLDAKEKRFLEAYASQKDLDLAAKTVQLSGAQIEARMAYSKIFADAVNAIEERLQIRKTVPAAELFEWTPEKRTRLTQVYIDTGDLATARDAIRVTPSEYYAEIERNTDFLDAVRGAEPLAMRALEERAIQMALAGNDKLLTKVLTAKLPEYKERLALDHSNTEKLSDQQLEHRLGKLLSKFRDRLDTIDAEYSVVEPERQTPALAYAGTDGPDGVAQQNQDLL